MTEATTDVTTIKESEALSSLGVTHEELFPRCMTLVEAARLLGVTRWTLKKWLEAELGLAFRSVGRGSRYLVRVDDVKALVSKKLPIKKW